MSPEPTKIRAIKKGDLTLVSVLMNHQMDSGRRKDEQGKLIPAWNIQSVTIKLGDKVILDAIFAPSVSKNPYLRFELTEGRVGDPIEVIWQDNRGVIRSDSTMIS